MNYTSLFYWLTVADNAKDMFITFSVIFSIISIASILFFLFARDENDLSLSASDDSTAERAKRWVWWSVPFAILFWSLYIFTPSKKDALLIVAGGQTLNFLTNDSTSKQIPHELSNFILSELKNMATDAKVELGIKSQKEKVIEMSKKMTTEELLNRIKTDDTFAKILLNKE